MSTLFASTGVCIVHAEEPILPQNWAPRNAADKVLSRLVKVTGPDVKGAHDAGMKLVDNRAYIVSMVNDKGPGESAFWPHVRCSMSIVDIDSLNVVDRKLLARGGQKFANKSLPKGACFVPRLLQIDENTLRCFFVSENPRVRESQGWYRDYDLRTETFANTIHKVKLKTSAGTFDFKPGHFYDDAAREGFDKKQVNYGPYFIDGFKRFDDKIYLVVNNYGGKQNAFARLLDDFATVEILGHFNRPFSVDMTEAAVNRLPDGTWMAICRQESKDRNYLFTTSSDGKNWTPARPKPFVQDGTSAKPTFDRFNGIYYLGWQDKETVNGVFRSVFNIDVSRDGRNWERKYRFETEKSFQYPTFLQHDGAIWLCVTQGDDSKSRKERIMFGKLEEVPDATGAR